MNDDVSYWTWISDTTIGLVTEREVYHWKVMEGSAAPSKVGRRRQLRLTRRSSIDTGPSPATKSSIIACRTMNNG